MKNTIKEKFRNNVLVKPLYKLKYRNKIEPRITVSVDREFNLDGQDVSVRKDIVNHSGKVFKSKDFSKRNIIFLCDDCDKYNDVIAKELKRNNIVNKNCVNRCKMLDDLENIKTDDIKANCVVNVKDKIDKSVQTGRNSVEERKECTWLRLCPLPKLPDESAISVVFRCIVCQLGLSTILVLWTFVWVFVINFFEGPYEVEISMEFEKTQNQLVIDLATELRQITPISPRWRSAIEQRIEQARHLTSVAVSRGAKSRPGQYWDLSGTFLFAVYVMTALGFGAPVPQTTAGRSSALAYAVLAVPTHLYLMCNASMCIVVHGESYINQIKCKLRDKLPFGLGKPIPVSESPKCSRNSELLRVPSRAGIGRKIRSFLGLLGACRSVPLAGLLYYGTGACVFGILRGLESQEVWMFPLEFTTSRQLEHIPGHYRIMYGLYVEGAMTLIACALAAISRHSNASISKLSEKYRLFATAN